MNKKFDELVAKHLNGTLKEDERQLLAIMLRAPENQFYLATIIDGQFFDDSLEEIGDEQIGNQIYRGIHQKLKEGLQQQEHMQEIAQVVQMPWYRTKAIRSLAIAASIILLVSLGVFLFVKPKQQPDIVKNETGKDVSPVTFLHHEVNTTGEKKSIRLPDGSLIVLENNSEITYQTPFVDRRNITLIGKADFSVAKDKNKPFTVFSGGIATTALGTQFTVNAVRNANRITVRLHEGKVVVRAVEKTNKMLAKEIYLLPGDEFIYDPPTVKVQSFRPKTDLDEKISNANNHDNPTLPTSNGSWYMFNNQKLDLVFDQLAAFYNTKIIYNRKDVRDIYFTAKYSRTDSLEVILTRIAIINQLTITKNDTAFIVSK